MSDGSLITAKASSRVQLVVGIAGPSGAGKSALAGAVASLLGDTALVLPYDAYYRDLSAVPPGDRERVNFDCPEALESELLIRHLKALRGGRAVRVPQYDFSRHCRLPSTRPAMPRKVVMVEGLFVLADERICEALDLRVYVDAPTQTRLERRIARDTAERGYAERKVRDDWAELVLPAETALVAPSRCNADVILTNDGPLEQQAEAVRRAIKGALLVR